MPPRPRPDLHAVPPAGGASAAPALPPETAPEPPDILAALEAGDDAAVWTWVRAQLPEPASLAVYALLVGVGVAGLVEWPAVLISALGQLVIDRRFGGVERVAADLRARLDAVSPPATARG